jgi:hypothetical protein
LIYDRHRQAKGVSHYWFSRHESGKQISHLPHLQPAEAELYRELVEDALGPSVRL